MHHKRQMNSSRCIFYHCWECFGKFYASKFLKAFGKVTCFRLLHDVTFFINVLFYLRHPLCCKNVHSLASCISVSIDSEESFKLFINFRFLNRAIMFAYRSRLATRHAEAQQRSNIWFLGNTCSSSRTCRNLDSNELSQFRDSRPIRQEWVVYLKCVAGLTACTNKFISFWTSELGLSIASTFPLMSCLRWVSGFVGQQLLS